MSVGNGINFKCMVLFRPLVCFPPPIAEVLPPPTTKVSPAPSMLAPFCLAPSPRCTAAAKYLAFVTKSSVDWDFCCHYPAEATVVFFFLSFFISLFFFVQVFLILMNAMSFV